MRARLLPRRVAPGVLQRQAGAAAQHRHGRSGCRDRRAGHDRGALLAVRRDAGDLPHAGRQERQRGQHGRVEADPWDRPGLLAAAALRAEHVARGVVDAGRGALRPARAGAPDAGARRVAGEEGRHRDRRPPDAARQGPALQRGAERPPVHGRFRPADQERDGLLQGLPAAEREGRDAVPHLRQRGRRDAQLEPAPQRAARPVVHGGRQVGRQLLRAVEPHRHVSEGPRVLQRGPRQGRRHPRLRVGPERGRVHRRARDDAEQQGDLVQQQGAAHLQVRRGAAQLRDVVAGRAHVHPRRQREPRGGYAVLHPRGRRQEGRRQARLLLREDVRHAVDPGQPRGHLRQRLQQAPPGQQDHFLEAHRREELPREVPAAVHVRIRPGAAEAVPAPRAVARRAEPAGVEAHRVPRPRRPVRRGSDARALPPHDGDGVGAEARGARRRRRRGGEEEKEALMATFWTHGCFAFAVKFLFF
mmetsp:Transcript_41295/g.127585  ORF Transcript_41295/g.127585 Transcript_41295/m.127585 type:complete len:473 (+) Transcript_41295:289-1707(+)